MGHTHSARPCDDSRFLTTKKGISAPPSVPSVQVTPTGSSQAVDSWALHTVPVHEAIPDAPRERVLWAARRPVKGCRALASSGSSWAAVLPGSDPDAAESAAQEAPLVVCARHKALAAQAELDALDANEVAALEKLDSSRDSCLAAGHPLDEVSPAYDSLRQRLESSAQTKRVALQAEAVAADAALEAALRAILAIIQAACLPDDSALADALPALLADEGTARAAVDSVPVRPKTRAFLDIASSASAPPPAGVLGNLQVLASTWPWGPAHEHNPHCDPACARTHDWHEQHEHSSTCSHQPAAPDAVYTAAATGRLGALQAAIAAGATTEESDWAGATALCVAAANGHLELACALVALGADPAPPHTMTSLHWAALSGHAPVVEFLLAGVDPNTRSQESGGGTALHMAASRGSASVVALLLRDPRVDPNAVDAKGATALSEARRFERAAVLEILLKHPRVRHS